MTGLEVADIVLEVVDKVGKVVTLIELSKKLWDYWKTHSGRTTPGENGGPADTKPQDHS